MNESTDHHYVPQWYQKRFLAKDEKHFYYLNLKPSRTVNGRAVAMREVERWGTKKCFQQPNLYSVRVPGYPKDLFEKLFFGKYDHHGSAAIKEVASAGTRVPISRESFGSFFEYLSVQALRTPKGLAWLRQFLPANATKQELLENVQKYQHMRCVMWVESFMDVLHHESEEVGFLLTDHPVTSYNKACYPRSRDCRFPNDPRFAWKGTQTIFPLDQKRCFVLTHTEYAHNQKINSQLTYPRTNPRMFGNTIAKSHEIVHREVSKQDVIHINRILKWRATRFLAARELDWLYPERHCARVEWPDLGKSLLPTTELWRNTGDIYVGLASGDIYSQDRFGRTPRTPQQQSEVEKRAKDMLEQFERIKANERNNSDPSG